jgi:hypothetical protein
VIVLPVPIAASRKRAHVVTPFAVCDIQALVVPFGGGRQASHFVIAALQPLAMQRRLDPCILDFSDVSAEFYL